MHTPEEIQLSDFYAIYEQIPDEQGNFVVAGILFPEEWDSRQLRVTATFKPQTGPKNSWKDKVIKW